MTVHEYYNGGRRPKTMRDKIEFTKNQPVEVTLGYATGKEGSNDRGEFYTYTTDSGGIFFATPTLNQKIQALEPRAGETLKICLQNAAGKNLWNVERVVIAAPMPMPAPTSNGNGHAAAPAIPVNGNGWSGLRIALFGAIDDCHAAEQYATGKGMSIRFSAEDVRTMANTSVINMTKGGR